MGTKLNHSNPFQGKGSLRGQSPFREAQQQLDEINNEKIADYKKQWHDWQYSFERDIQSLLDALSSKQKN